MIRKKMVLIIFLIISSFFLLGSRDVVAISPIADNISIITDEDTPVDITLTAKYPENGSLTYSIVENPSHGTVSISGAVARYTPYSNYNGPDSFTYMANDGSAASNTAIVSISVSPVNDAPVADAKSATVNEDIPASITLTATDPENDPLTYSVVNQPSHGTVSISGAVARYTPDSNYNGPDSFTYKANDGSADSNTVTVSITINPFNDAPVADSKSTSTNEDTPVDIALNATDPENDPLTYSIVNNPSHGTVSISGAVARYRPSANYNGPDSFTFKTNDGNSDGNTATVSITVRPVNDAPVAAADSYTIDEDKTLTVAAPGVLGNDTDVDGNTLSAVKVADPSNGLVTLNTNGGFTYTPNANFNGQDSFTYKANDGTVDSNLVTVSINVNPVNDAPVADAKITSTNEDTPVDIALNATDSENDPLTYSIVNNPSHGTVSISGAVARYRPSANYNGPDSFTYKANDGNSDGNTATVSITVRPVNDAPVAAADSYTIDEDKTLTVAAPGVLGNDTDVDGNTLSAAKVTDPSNGSVILNTNGGFTYTPNANFNGQDSFTYKANDGTADSNLATVSINVNPVNDAPVADAKNATSNEDTPVEIALNAIDSENDPLTYSIVNNPSHGTVSISGAIARYRPSANYNGPDSFTYKANDGKLDSNSAKVSIVVKPVNDAPVAYNVNITTNEDIPVNVTLNATDIESDPLNYSITISVTHGTLSGIVPNLIYTPFADYNGPDSFTYKANDGKLDSSSATVSITINPVNDAPIQSPIGNKEVYKGQELTFMMSATDVDSDFITYRTNATKGELSAGIYTWTPGDSDAGEYLWEFNSSDAYGGTDRETIKVTVRNPLEFGIKFVEPSIINGNETWINASAGHIGKYIGVDGTFKNIGNDTLNLTITETYNNESREWLPLKLLAPNETLSYARLFGKPTFEINSTGVYGDVFTFTFKMDVKGQNISISYTNTTTIRLHIHPIFRMKKANGGIIILSDNSPGTTITYTLEANSSVNLTNVSIYDAFYPAKYFNSSIVEANKPQSVTYTYQATTRDLSSMRCEESKFNGSKFDYPCIINLATLTASINGSEITDTDYVELFVCKLNDANCLTGYSNYRIKNRGSSIAGTAYHPSTSGGGGGGGGGIPPSEDFKNIEKREVREMDVFGKSLAAYVFKAADPVMAVSFESSVSENGVPVAVEVLRDRSKKISDDAPGQSYKYFNIYVGTSGFTKKIRNGVIVYRVNNSWLEDNGLDVGDIRLFKWEGGWVEKTTEIAERKPNQTYYASLVGNFSSFAIAGIKKPKMIPTAGQFPISPGESNENGTFAEDAIIKPPSDFNIILAIMPLIGIIGLLYYVKISKMKNKYR